MSPGPGPGVHPDLLPVPTKSDNIASLADRSDTT